MMTRSKILRPKKQIPGVLITFEGMEGSGKTTQIRKLQAWLRTQGQPVVVTHEPGGTVFAEKLRAYLLTPELVDLPPEAELFLYEIARHDHVKNVIQPALLAGKWVLCDRFTDSTLAYQGYGRGLVLKEIVKKNKWAAQGVVPHLTFLLDVCVEEGLGRAKKRQTLDRLERENKLFHHKVRQAFLDLAKKEKKRFRILDGNKDAKQLSLDIRGTVVREMAEFLQR